ncbi:stathmin domain-containing protein 1 [Polypterus senegalus]|uniref:stathmin domain-containing protein 1 n=1 Tax=Polypterus senegalus TaxID=55291 RepID=UPI00196469C7|nr:stathmin domain-containing protein 1 [Polypterus senegalus]
MGCGNSRSAAVIQPASENRNGWADKTPKRKRSSHHELTLGTREGSAISKQTTDSGLGLENELPGAIQEKVTPIRPVNGPTFLQEPKERQKSSDILEELQMQGIIQKSHTVVKNGEAYDVMVETTEKQLKKPPLHLEKLKTKQKKQKPVTKEEIENKMRAVEERRKTREEELKKKLRTEKGISRSITSMEFRPFSQTDMSLENEEEGRIRPKTSLEGERLASSRKSPESDGVSEKSNDFGALELDPGFRFSSQTPDDKEDVF